MDLNKAWLTFSGVAVVVLVPITGIIAWASVENHVDTITTCTTTFVGG